jgi:hypothetical protein
VRRSITGPLIVVAIGVIFLLRNFRPDLLALNAIADYWPFLLIGAGIIGLVEVLFHASRGEAAPVRPFSGGTIFWIVVICFFFAVLSHRPMSFNIGDFDTGRITVLGSDYNYDTTLSESTAGATRLVLDNVHGDLTLRPGTDDSVRVTGQTVVRAFSRSDADKANRAAPVRIDREGDEIVVRATDSAVNRARVTADLQVALPKNLSVEVRGPHGDVSVQGIDGGVLIDSGRGDVTLADIGGPVKIASSRSGSIRVTRLRGDFDLSGRGGDVRVDNVGGETTVSGEYSGTLEFTALAKPFRFQSSRTEFSAEAVPGTINLDLSDLRLRNVAGPVRFHSTSRDIDASQVTNGLDLVVDRGDIRVDATQGPLPKIDVHSHNGDISLALPLRGQFQIQGSTGQGEVEDEFGSPLEVVNSGKSSSIRGRTGDGPAINVTTDRGTLTVRKG